MNIKRQTSLLLAVLLVSILVMPGCLRKKRTVVVVETIEEIDLTFYGLFDNSDIYDPIIEAYETANRGVNISYRKFTDPDEYLDVIINELAEGEGPDIFMMHNTWFPKHYKKLTPAPSDIVTPGIFRELFVEIAADEMIIPDDDNVEQVWGLPIYVDTLALYYNKDHYEEAIPSRGRPPVTWDELADDVIQLNREDKSFERFERAAIAMGRSDNVLRTFDTLMLLLLQYKVDFYNTDLTKVQFKSDPDAFAALELLTSFSLPSQKNYSWNRYLADENSAEKEITTFAKGKVSMLIGYSYTYSDIIDEINRLKAEGDDVIDIDDVKINEIPQVYDPDTTGETREAYASYFVPVVSRTSDFSEEAWGFLATLVQDDNLSYYNENTHRPSANRSLITEQALDPIYGVFAEQVGYASSIPMSDADAYELIFLRGVEDVIDTQSPEVVLTQMANAIEALIPADGVKPIYVPTQ